MRGANNLQRTLTTLAARFDVTLSSPRRVPRTTLTNQDHPLILEGIASTGDIDVDRVRFAPFCYGSLAASIPLLIEHERPVGTAALTYDPAGGLRVRTSPLTGVAATYGAFSISVNNIQFELRAPERKSFHAEILACDLTECSLTEYPHNGAALVLNRMRSSAQAALYGHAQDYFVKLSEIITLLQKEVHP